MNKEKFLVKRICPDPISVPVGVEAVWTLISPKTNTSQKLKYIAVCSVYYRGPKSTKKQELFDHIAHTYHYLSAKYGSHLEYIIAGDTNRLNLSPILNLSPRLTQVVKVPTRLNPSATLDPIITTLKKYYAEPVTKPPINPDSVSSGKPSDHLIVLMQPISATVPISPRSYRTVHYRPITESGCAAFQSWIEGETWSDVYTCTDVHKKAAQFQKMIMKNFEKCFPVKTLKICDDDKPWVTKGVKKLDRLRKREFLKHKKSKKWVILNQKFQQKCKDEKENYYERIVKDLKESNVSQWYSKVKRMAGQDQERRADLTLDELMGLNDAEQAERIAEHYASISSLYEPISDEDFPEYSNEKISSPLKVSISKVEKIIRGMNKKAAAVPGDIPLKIVSKFSNEFSRPLAHIINQCINQGIYPDIWKVEYVTPVPKIFPPEHLNDLRKISGLLNFSKITDKILAEYIADDMQYKRDKSQYGNQKKISIQHYLVNMLHKILTSLDENTSNKSIAVLLKMVDWSQAFDRLSHKIGIESFIKNGVRPALIPILISFFKNRKMTVKWNGKMSTLRPLPGGGPQGGTLGIEEYLSQSNDNADHIEEDERFKFIDDLSILEIINLLSIGLASYNCRNQVPSDIGIDNLFLDPQNLKSQKNLDKIQEWTENRLMKLNTQKSNYMVFNFAKNLKFNTRLNIDNIKLDQISETKLLGLRIRDDLSWKSNTDELTRKAYSRMMIIKKLIQFNVPLPELVQIYILYIRSVVEQSAVVWHASITIGEQKDLERIQKVALRLILGDNYTSYNEALKQTGLDTLRSRRTKLSLNFALKCLKSEKTSHMFPLNSNPVDTRHHEIFYVTKARTSRLFKSAIPYMQRLLNDHYRKK